MKIAIIGSCRFEYVRATLHEVLSLAGHLCYVTPANSKTTGNDGSNEVFHQLDLKAIQEADLVVLVDRYFNKFWDTDTHYVGQHTQHAIDFTKMVGKMIWTVTQVPRLIQNESPFATFPLTQDKQDYLNEILAVWNQNIPVRPEPEVPPAPQPEQKKAEPVEDNLPDDFEVN